MIKRLIKNTSSNLLLLFVKIAITLIMTPLYLSNMGDYDYGIWIVIASVVGYMGLLDLGIKPAISKFTSQFNVNEDKGSLNILYSTSTLFLIAVGLFCALTLFFIGVYYPEVFFNQPEGEIKYTLVLIIIAIQLALMFPGFAPASVLEGLHLFSLANNISIINSIISATILFFIISPSNALFSLALVNAIGISIKGLLLFFYVAKKSKYQLRPQFKFFKRSVLSELLSFGIKSFVQGLSYRIETVSAPIIISTMLSPALVPFYSLPAALISYIKNIGFTITKTFMPQFSEIIEQGSKEKEIQFYLNASKWTILTILPIICLATILGKDFISLWVGVKYGENSQSVLILLCFFTLIPFLDPCKGRYLTAKNKHGILAKLFPISAAISLLISIVLVEPYGIVGVATGSLVSVFIFSPYYLSYSCKLLGISVFKYLKTSVFPCLIPTLLPSLAIFFVKGNFEITKFIDLFIFTAFYFILYFPLVWGISINRIEKIKIIHKSRALLTLIKPSN
jgi:O-antigen/teichoic acid export membrane protein